MNEPQTIDLTELRGLVATVNLTGSVTAETSACWTEMRAWCVANGFHNLEWLIQPAQLVEAGRDAALQHALDEEYDFCLQIDGDATFGADFLARILKTAYAEVPDSDVVGAYAQLKNPPFLPTIDTGTGTWEPHFPGEGVLPVIRTGGHFLLVKTDILPRCGPPWFRTRRTIRPVDALREVDNYARCKLDGENPLSEADEWTRLMDLAERESGAEGSVGEDSGFCDRVKAAGGSIYVDTRLVSGHVSKRVIQPNDLRSAMRERDQKVRYAVGVME